ncbi:MAG: MMPL family transporter, partial [Verrucomicrobiota bacterium]
MARVESVLRKLLGIGWLPLLIVALLVGFFGLQLGQLKVDADAEALLDQGDPDLVNYRSIQKNWGQDEYAVVCVTGDDWFTEKGIGLLKKIRDDLSAIRHAGVVLSIFDVPLLRQQEKPSLLGMLGGLKNLESPGIKLDRAKLELLEHELMVGNLLSEDGRSFGFMVVLAPPAPGSPATLKDHRREMVEDLRELGHRWEPELAEPVRFSGMPVIVVNLIEHVEQDLKRFGFAALALFSLALFLVYRQWRFVWAPLATAAVPVFLILGYMALTGEILTVVTSNLPLLLFVLMLPYSVYFMESYRERRLRGLDGGTKESVARSVGAVVVPCLFSCLTTVMGFAALSSSDILPVKRFGILMAVGMIFGFFIVFLILPVLFGWLKSPDFQVRKEKDGSKGLVRVFESLSLRHPALIAVFSLLLLIVALAGASRLSSENKFTHYFWPGSEVYQGFEFIDQHLGGTTPLEVVLHAPEENFFKSPAGIAALERVEGHLRALPESGNVRSLASVSREVTKSFSTMQPEAMIGLLTRAAPGVLSEFVTPDFSQAKVSVRMIETADDLNRNEVLRTIREKILEDPELKETRPEITGVFLLYANMLNSLIASQRETVVWVLAAILLVLLVLFRSVPLA